MVKNVLLGLLARRPKHGYELKGDFEDLLGGTWELNLGQVYLTLGRLERDGLVSSDVVPQETRPDRKVYSITELGQKELDRWAIEPVADPVHLRDELILKVLVQNLLDSNDAYHLLWSQRQRHLELLAELTALRDESGQPLSTLLVIEAGIAHMEADLKWLEIVEQALEAGGNDDGSA
jgi:DNA-binding PadR family transcriptional regulator